MHETAVQQQQLLLLPNTRQRPRATQAAQQRLARVPSTSRALRATNCG